ncbi:DUF4303 domain-containing protein [Streptomyces acidicola]|uniref:DUF4303 domain-containing protein n=1 Tax=Streptomyces acidicola TaxID=2596892 RepID=UPI0037F6B6AF
MRGAMLLAAARTAFTSLAEASGDGGYCGYAMYSDADARTVCCAVNTREHLARAQARDPDDAEYYRWNPAEWALESVGHEHLADVNRLLLSSSPHREHVYETCVAALETLVAEGALGRDEDTVVVFAVSDHTDPQRETEWIRRLNTPSQARRHAQWIRTVPTQT